MIFEILIGRPSSTTLLKIAVMNLLNNAGKLNENWPQKGEKSKRVGFVAIWVALILQTELLKLCPAFELN